MGNTVKKQSDRKNWHPQNSVAGRTDTAYSVSIDFLRLRPESIIPGAKLARITGVAPEVLHAFYPLSPILHQVRGKSHLRRRKEISSQMQQLVDCAHQLGFMASILTDQSLIMTVDQSKPPAKPKLLAAVHPYKRSYRLSKNQLH